MPLSLTDIGLGIVLPAAVSCALVRLAGRSKSPSIQGAMASAAFVAGFITGYFSLQLGPARPESHWQWMPWILLLTLLPAALPCRPRSVLALRWVLTTGIFGVAAMCLVPDWDDLFATRNTVRGFFFVVMTCNAVAMSVVDDDASSRGAMRQLVTGSLLLSALLMLSGSLRFTQVGLCGFAAAFGLWIASLLRTEVSVRAVGIPVSVLFAGMMLIGQVNSYSGVPAAAYLMIAVVPAATGCVHTFLRRNQHTKPRVLIAALPTALAVAAVAWAAYAEYGPG